MKEKKFLLISFAITLGYITYLIRDFLPPFVISFAIAYFLNPLTNFLHQRIKLPRYLAASLVVIFFILILVGIFLTIIPPIYGRTIEIIQIMPSYLSDLNSVFYPKIQSYLSKYGIHEKISGNSFFEDMSWLSRIEGLASQIFSKTFESTSAIISSISFTFLVPIIVFYLLKDWDSMLKHISRNIPLKVEKQFKEICSAIDISLSGYARGQAYVCMILALFYGIFLSICNLNSGFAIGMITGILAFIPYIGFGIGMVFAFLTALLQWGFATEHLLAVACVFAVGQVIESNFLVPILIGKKVGIHPLWLIFGLFFFGSLFGILGVVLAVPLTAIFSVVIKHFLKFSHKI